MPQYTFDVQRSLACTCTNPSGRPTSAVTDRPRQSQTDLGSHRPTSAVTDQPRQSETNLGSRCPTSAVTDQPRQSLSHAQPNPTAQQTMKSEASEQPALGNSAARSLPRGCVENCGNEENPAPAVSPGAVFPRPRDGTTPGGTQRDTG